MAEDPFCGMKVDEKTAKHKTVNMEKTYHFWVAGCKEAFEKTPQKRKNTTPLNNKTNY